MGRYLIDQFICCTFPIYKRSDWNRRMLLPWTIAVDIVNCYPMFLFQIGDPFINDFNNIQSGNDNNNIGSTRDFLRRKHWQAHYCIANSIRIHEPDYPETREIIKNQFGINTQSV